MPGDNLCHHQLRRLRCHALDYPALSGEQVKLCQNMDTFCPNVFDDIFKVFVLIKACMIWFQLVGPGACGAVQYHCFPVDHVTPEGGVLGSRHRSAARQSPGLLRHVHRWQESWQQQWNRQ